MDNVSTTQEYRPELLSRRGELVAWMLSVVVFAAWGYLNWRGYSIIGAMKFLAFFLLFAALSISLGNWMDRRTFIRISHQGIHFENGLRRASLTWDAIREVQVFGSGWGRKVRVLGDERVHFDFRTLGEVKVGDQVKGRVGFVDGEEILQCILERSHLEETEHSDSSYYYVRK